jgi:hypothetical protein
LRLEVETSWEELGHVDAAMFSIGRIDFAPSQGRGNPRSDVFVWVGRDKADPDAALDVLLAALGISRDALTFRGDMDTGFADLRPDPNNSQGST